LQKALNSHSPKAHSDIKEDPKIPYKPPIFLKELPKHEEVKIVRPTTTKQGSQKPIITIQRKPEQKYSPNKPPLNQFGTRERIKHIFLLQKVDIDKNFRRFALTNSDFLGPHEFEGFLKTVDDRFTEDEINSAFSKCDPFNSKKITLDNFKKYLVSP